MSPCYKWYAVQHMGITLSSSVIYGSEYNDQLLRSTPLNLYRPLICTESLKVHMMCSNPALRGMRLWVVLGRFGQASASLFPSKSVQILASFPNLLLPAPMVRLAFLVASLSATAISQPFAPLKNDVNVIEAVGPTIPADQWFESQLLDHFDTTNTQTWKQRYHFNNAWATGPNAPVFVQINGQTGADPKAVTSKSRFMNELAKKYGALTVSLEHRFYGQSQPTGDLSVESYQYFTMKQALADIATFQDYFNSAFNLTTNNKWVLFGSSYAGMLTTYAKAKYPNRYAGSFASSAPIQLKADFFEYADVVAFGLKKVGGTACFNTVQTALKQFHQLVQSTKPTDVAQLKKSFKPCSPMKTDSDRATLEWWLFDKFQGAAQYDGQQDDGLAFVCDMFTNTTTTATPLERLAKYAKHYWDSSKCTGSDFNTEILSPLLDTSMANNAPRGWFYMCCNELGAAQTTALSSSLFRELGYVTYDRIYQPMCDQAFGIKDTKARVDAGNAYFGGVHMDVPNVVWTNGNLDPISAMGFTNTTTPVNPRSDVVFIDGTSHCADVYTGKELIVPQWAHDRVERNIKRFLE
ncbi:Aste57867_8345 [Aphanomyces stellatus]|uniref:Aste57867_8345 protein n=1 Tax=Aphanomyces stellatus TaxID=120398 RepID=A0A485KK13_9STRA|nr:hypothetical protein As57867_008313 [Aphanomyces stellatus]VFT85232.1 Aste57867_8345 [Aphanomyces stellatus]